MCLCNDINAVRTSSIQDEAPAAYIVQLLHLGTFLFIGYVEYDYASLVSHTLLWGCKHCKCKVDMCLETDEFRYIFSILNLYYRGNRSAMENVHFILIDFLWWG